MLSKYWYLVLLFTLAACAPQSAGDQDWSHYKADPASSSYSTLEQINVANVSQLEVAWEFRAGDENPRTIQSNPSIIDGIMYVTSPKLDLIALDAATGAQQWRFKPSDHLRGFRASRGVTYWAEGDDKRVYYPAGTRLFAVNAEDGSPLTSFGDGGSIGMANNLSRDAQGKPVSITTPPVIFEDIIILGSSVGDGNNNVLPNPPGDIRGFDLHTGELVWTFHVIPHPGEFGYDTWPPDAWSSVGAGGGGIGGTKSGDAYLAFALGD